VSPAEVLLAGSYYDGTPYSLVFDPMLRGLHQRVAAWVPEGCSCLDVCCGPGGLTFQLARRCERVVGVDLSEKMITRARQLADRHGLGEVAFQVGDATDLGRFVAGSFDVATVAMGLHEMPVDVRERVIPELLRVAASAVIVDFAVPMPVNLAGIRNRAIEFAAGPAHFGGFRDYTRRGGLLPLVEAAGALVTRSRRLDGGTLLQLEIARR
jgi:ubiquinone/menaquinone biosynthesis C-methylase UbiE